MEQASFSKYGKDFQEKLVYLIMTERPFCDQIGEVLDISFLELRYLQTLVAEIYDYKKRYDVHPSLKVLGSIIKSEISNDDDAVKEQIVEYFKRSITDVEIIRDADYIRNFGERYNYNFTDNEVAALNSFIFNLGRGALDQVTASGTRSKKEIASKMLEYNKAGGKQLAGLVKRRKDERDVFIGEAILGGGD